MPLGANITLAELPEPELRQLFPHEELQIPVSCGGLGAGAGGRMDMRAVGLVPVRRASRYCTGFFVLIHSYLTLMGRGAGYGCLVDPEYGIEQRSECLRRIKAPPHRA